MDSPVLVVVGLGFGDEGKGTTVDALARAAGPATVVRFNGGPQASHHVVLADGRWHGFSQFGAGTFVAGCTTHLGRATYVEPGNLLREADALELKGVHAPLETLTLEPRCLLVTPAHKLVGQVQELARGASRHGSVGMGVGQAVRDARTRGGEALGVADLLDGRRLRDRLADHVATHWALARPLAQAHPSAEMTRTIAHFERRLDLEALLAEYRVVATRLAGRLRRDDDLLPDLVRSGRRLILEGAQGTLLDPVVGFPPHITKTPCTAHAAAPLLDGLAVSPRVVGVLRGYAHRHGPGPLVGEDPHLAHHLHDEHNLPNRWQGPFRVGLPDLLMARYAVAVNGRVDALVVTGLDQLGGVRPLRVCASYRHPGPLPPAAAHRFMARSVGDDETRVEGLRVPLPGEGPNPPSVGETLARCRPGTTPSLDGWEAWDHAPRALDELPGGLRDYVGLLSSSDGLGVPVAILSLGPTGGDKLHVMNPTSTLIHKP